MNKFCTQKLVVVESIDPDKRVNLLPVVQRLCTDAGSNESGEGRGVDGNSLLVHVVEDGESLGELVLPCESLNVAVDGARVLAVERQGLRKRVLLSENRAFPSALSRRCWRSGWPKRRRRRHTGLESVVVAGAEGVWREWVEMKGHGRWRGCYRLHVKRCLFDGVLRAAAAEEEE